MATEIFWVYRGEISAVLAQNDIIIIIFTTTYTYFWKVHMILYFHAKSGFVARFAHPQQSNVN